MRRTASVLAALVVWCSVASAFAFGPEGHQAVGAIADQLLAPRAAEEVKTRLGMPLRVAATWADCAKDVRRQPNGSFKYLPNPAFHDACKEFETMAGRARMEDYVKRNFRQCPQGTDSEPCHKIYHFAEIAIQNDRYDRSLAGTSNVDIVSAIDAAVAFLQKKPVIGPVRIKDDAEAILMLAHLVGDLHQPLHVGAVYLDGQDHEINPGKKADPRTETRGGNLVQDGSTNLHADWDEIPRTIDPAKISEDMMKSARTFVEKVDSPPGRAEAWANDTLLAAKAAFKGVSFTHADAAKGHWKAHFDDRHAYFTAKDDLQRKQLAKAGARLASLLNAIWP